MESGIHIEGGTVDTEGVEAVAQSIVLIFGAAQHTNMDQETVRAALHTVERMASVTGATISGCHVEGGTTKVVNFGDDE